MSEPAVGSPDAASAGVDLDMGEVTGGCHCGAVRFRARLANGLRSARRCTCSYCRMRGAVAVSVTVGELTLTSGEERLARYAFNTGAAQHFFCGTCGIYTHHQRRSNPGQYGVNLAALDGLSPFDLAAVPVLDGVHHPADGSGAGTVGMLRFVAGEAGEVEAVAAGQRLPVG